MVEIGKTQWPADACCFVIDVCLNGKATGGREPRIISLASSHVSPDGTVLSTFHRYVKTDVSADAAMVSNVHGLDYLTLQAKANGKTFSEVGAEWVTWLRQRLNGATRAVLVTAGGLKTNAYTSLLAEMVRAELVLPRAAEWTALDLVYAARQQKTYSSVSTEEWPIRQKPTAAQQRSGKTPPPELTLESMCSYELKVASQKARPSTSAAPPASIDELCGPDAQHSHHSNGKMAAVVIGAFGTRRLVGKTVALPLNAIKQWAKDLVQYEQHRREDRVPPEWQVLTSPPLETPADGPGFTPQV